MRVLFDLNVLLDLILDRTPFSDDAKAATRLILNNSVSGYVTSLSVVTLYYIVTKNASRDQARLAVQRCLATFGVIPVGRGAIEAAFMLGGRDFEDDVQSAAAHAARLDRIITRDLWGFTNSLVPAMTPKDFVINHVKT